MGEYFAGTVKMGFSRRDGSLELQRTLQIERSIPFGS